MRKHLGKYGIASILFMVLMAFISTNNFGYGFGLFNKVNNEVSYSEVHEKITEDVLTPIRASIEKTNPHFFMTKCYNDLNFNIYLFNGDIADTNATFYKDSYINGVVNMIECGSPSSVCSFQYYLKDGTVQIKEGFLKNWIPFDEFIEKIENPAVE